MPQISYIHHKDILEARRFDAEYFKPEYLVDKSLLEKKGYNLLADIANVKGGKRLPLGESFSTDGIPYIRAEDIKNSFIQQEQTPRISEKLHKKLVNYQTKKDDILITIVGNSVGDVGFVRFDLKKCNLTENAAKVINLKKIIPEMFFIYMLSRYGQNQIHREKVGTAQPKLALERIKRFRIPILPESFQLQIESIVKEAHTKQTKSKSLYHQAEQLLLSELGLLDHQIKHQLTFTTTKSAIDTATRYDAEYFQPKYDEIIKKIEAYQGGWDYVKNMITYKKGIEVGTEAYSEVGKDFVRVSDFSIHGIENVSRKISDEYYQDLKSKYQPKKGEILFTKDGTIGISSVMQQNYEGIVSGAFLRLSLQDTYNSFEKECLALILNSLLCKLQVEKLSGGALIAHLKPSDFENFKIPLLSPTIQTHIAELITQSHQLRRESKQLLEDAKKMVEEEIEKA